MNTYTFPVQALLKRERLLYKFIHMPCHGFIKHHVNATGMDYTFDMSRKIVPFQPQFLHRNHVLFDIP